MTLTDYIKENGIKQKFLAKRLGWTESKLSRIISKATGVSLADAVKIEDETGGEVKARDLL